MAALLDPFTLLTSAILSGMPQLPPEAVEAVRGGVVVEARGAFDGIPVGFGHVSGLAIHFSERSSPGTPVCPDARRPAAECDRPRGEHGLRGPRS